VVASGFFEPFDGCGKQGVERGDVGRFYNGYTEPETPVHGVVIEKREIVGFKILSLWFKGKSNFFIVYTHSRYKPGQRPGFQAELEPAHH
jgi:hypothetical protein